MDERNEDNFEVENDHVDGVDHVEVDNTEIHMSETEGSGSNPVAIVAIVVLLALLAYGLYVFMNRGETPVDPTLPPPVVETEEVEETEESVETEDPADEVDETEDPVLEGDVDVDVDTSTEVPAESAE